MSSVRRRASLGLIAINLLAVYVLWGSTAPAIRVAVATLPPWLMAGGRFIVAGSILWTFVRLRRAPMPSIREWRDAAIGGIALLVLGNGLFAWMLQYVPSGIGALFFALSPFFMALFAYVVDRERLPWWGIGGLLLGFTGMIYLVAPSSAGSLPMVATVVGLISAVAWGLGSVMQRGFVVRDLVQGSAMQMLVAGVVLVVLGLATGERLVAKELTPHALLAVSYLVVFGSIVGYSCYLWLMRNVPTPLASTYAYVNPLVAIVVSAALLHEPLTAHTLTAAAIILCGVALLMLASPPHASTDSRVSSADAPAQARGTGAHEEVLSGTVVSSIIPSPSTSLGVNSKAPAGTPKS